MVRLSIDPKSPQQGPTKPNRVADPNEYYQPIEIEEPPVRTRNCFTCGCLPLLVVFVLLLGAYFFLPARTNILLLGIDRTPDGSAVGRTDTNILISIIPLKPDVNMLSIPRDLWVNIPGVGENRINTAHFFAEANQEGSGPAAVLETVRANFGVTVRYYVRVKFSSFVEIVDAMGGLNIDLTDAMAGYAPGQYNLNGEQALAFARNRTGSDDFFRMQNGQFLLKAAFRQMFNPASWVRIPAVANVFFQSVDTNIPAYLWPRLGLAVLRAGPDGIDNRTITREMVNPWTTDLGANVLLPNWDAINPVLMEMFAE
ncbi:MAG: LCP family protein [Bellilinea sp.]